MRNSNYFARTFCALIVCFVSFFAYGEAVYVLDHVNNLFCFDVLDDELIYRDTLSAGFSGGVDLAIDNSSDILFRSCEFNNVIEIIHATSLEVIKSYDYSSIASTAMTGIVYDDNNSVLLGTKRNTNRLYIFDWAPSTLTLTLRQEHVPLAYINEACDLSLNGNILYVSEYHYFGAATYEDVYAYDMSDDFSFIEKIDMDDPVVTIDYNADGDSIYGGAWQGSSCRYLIKRCYDPNTLVKKALDYNVVGISANRNVAGRVFMTTLNNTLQLWDASGVDPNNFVLLDEYGNGNSDGVSFSGLAGLVVGDEFINEVIDLDKYDDSDGCVWPEDELTYTISWENLVTVTAEDVTVIDYLPEGVYYPEGYTRMDPNDLLNPLPPDPDYDQYGHSYSWDIGDVGPGESGSVTIRVVVTEKAEPGMILNNKVVLTSSFGTDFKPLETDVCCWDAGGIVYVDETASGNENGTSWGDAYTRLSDALNRINNTTCEQSFDVYVARGTYKPGLDMGDTFAIADGVSVYGGFASGGCDFAERNPGRNITVLSGQIDAFMNNDAVVTMGDETLLDGFTVMRAEKYGIYGSGNDFTIENCRIVDNTERGIFAEDGDLIVRWCEILNNGVHGINHVGENFIVLVENTQIVNSTEHGILCEGSISVINNCIISRNGHGSDDFFGITIAMPTATPVLYNNTIAYNANEGLAWFDDGTISDPNDKDWPDIQNCILWYNNDDGVQLAGYDFTQYSCVFDPNNPSGTATPDAFGNITCAPGFAYEYSSDPNVLLNVHLAYNSPCKDVENTNLTYEGQVDIDGEERVVGTYVDIGADEVYSCDDDLSEDDVYNEIDWTADGVVNFKEYSLFAEAWLSADPNYPLCDPNNGGYVWDPNAPGFISEADKLRYSSRCDIDQDLDVDLGDLSLLCDEWLWIACWKDSQFDRIESMAMGGGESAMMAIPMMGAMSMEAAEPEAVFASESDLVRFVLGVKEIIDFMDAAMEENPDDCERFLEIKEGIEAILEELRGSVLVK